VKKVPLQGDPKWGLRKSLRKRGTLPLSQLRPAQKPKKKSENACRRRGEKKKKPE